MNEKIELPEKQRKHRWVTEALSEGTLVLSVWPSPDEVNNPKKQEKFLDTIKKVGNDPRVTKVERRLSKEYSVVYLFDLANA